MLPCVWLAGRAPEGHAVVGCAAAAGPPDCSHVLHPAVAPARCTGPCAPLPCVWVCSRAGAAAGLSLAPCVQTVMLPLLLPGSSRLFYPLSPEVSSADRIAVDNVVKISNFLTGEPRAAWCAAGRQGRCRFCRRSCERDAGSCAGTGPSPGQQAGVLPPGSRRGRRGQGLAHQAAPCGMLAVPSQLWPCVQQQHRRQHWRRATGCACAGAFWPHPPLASRPWTPPTLSRVPGAGGSAERALGGGAPEAGLQAVQELAPFLPALASEIVPQVRPGPSAPTGAAQTGATRGAARCCCGRVCEPAGLPGPAGCSTWWRPWRAAAQANLSSVCARRWRRACWGASRHACCARRTCQAGEAMQGRRPVLWHAILWLAPVQWPRASAACAPAQAAGRCV